MVARAIQTSVRADRHGVLIAIALQIVGALSALGVVLASKLAIDGLVATSDGGAGLDTAVIVALALLAFTTALSGSVGVLQGQQQRLLGEKVGQHLWRDLLGACAAVDLVTWESPDFMDRLERVRGSALQRPTAVVSALLTLVGSAVGMVGMAVALLLIEPLLIPVLLAAGVPAILVSRRASSAEFHFATRTAPAQRRRLYFKRVLSERSHAAELRAFHAAPLLIDRHDVQDRSYLADLSDQVRLRQRLGLVSTLSSALALAATLLIIVFLVDRGDLTLAEAGASAIAARLLGTQLGTAFASVGSLIEAGPFLRDLESFLEHRPGDPGKGTKRPLIENLQLTNVTFRYPGQAALAVDRVDLTLPAGKIVALVGENGCGKTTLAKIVCGLFEAHGGSVHWDGSAIDLHDLRASVSPIFQDFVRYQMSGADNIAISQPDELVNAHRVHTSAHRSGIAQALSALPGGYDTPLGRELADGTDLSGGQWQRLALARALYRDVDLLVLDEPTAALDPQAEHDLFSDVRSLLEGRTGLLISHRWSSVRLADYIYVMEAGRILEEGSHDELVNRRGRYAALYALQAAAYLR